MSEGASTKEPAEGPDLAEAAERDETAEARVRGLVAALRSGDYIQTRKVLARHEGDDEPVSYCCLGVACEVAKEQGLALRRDLSKASALYRYEGPDNVGSGHTMPLSVWRWFRLGADNPHLKVPDEVADEVADAKFQELRGQGRVHWVATELNDDFLLTLAQIGDCFEYTFLPQDWEVTRDARG